MGWITVKPSLGPIYQKRQWNGKKPVGPYKFSSAAITYKEHGRNDSTEVISGSFPSKDNFVECLFDFKGVIQGGTLNVKGTIELVNDGSNVPFVSQEDMDIEINGTNPTKQDIRTLLNELPLQVIAYKESRFRQFDHRGMPLFGPPNGFGIMMLDPPGTASQIWNWRENVAEGISRYQEKIRQVDQHYKNVYAAHPEAPKLTEDQLKLAIYQRYNSGYYWVWNDQARVWEKSGTNSAYGDDAVRIEELVSSGKPPNDW